MRKINTDGNKGIISLHDTEGIEMRLCCTPETFEPALRLVREHVTV